MSATFSSRRPSKKYRQFQSDEVSFIAFFVVSFRHKTLSQVQSLQYGALGLAIVEVLAKREPSAIHILGCRNTAAGDKAVEKLREDGINSAIEVIQLDVTNDDHIQAAVDHVRSKYQRLDGMTKAF